MRGWGGHCCLAGHAQAPTPDAQSPHLAEDLLSIRLQLSAQLHAGQVSLQKQVGLDMWVVELRVIQLVGNLLGQLESGAKSSW